MATAHQKQMAGVLALGLVAGVAIAPSADAPEHVEPSATAGANAELVHTASLPSMDVDPASTATAVMTAPAGSWPRDVTFATDRFVMVSLDREVVPRVWMRDGSEVPGFVRLVVVVRNASLETARLEGFVYYTVSP